MENFEEKSVDSVDAGFYSQEISSHVLQGSMEESEVGMSEGKEAVNSSKPVASGELDVMSDVMKTEICIFR